MQHVFNKKGVSASESPKILRERAWCDVVSMGGRSLPQSASVFADCCLGEWLGPGVLGPCACFPPVAKGTRGPPTNWRGYYLPKFFLCKSLLPASPERFSVIILKVVSESCAYREGSAVVSCCNCEGVAVSSSLCSFSPACEAPRSDRCS